MIVVLPIAFWLGALVADIVYVATRSASWYSFGFVCMGLGILGALAAAVAGAADWLSLPRGTRAFKIGLIHGAINLSVATLFIVNFGLRWIANDGLGLPATPPAGGTWAGCVALSILAVGVLTISGWLGGELVYVEGVAVHQPAAYRAERPSVRDTLRPPPERQIPPDEPRPGAGEGWQ
jgi:uncharacterized membrane protein